MPTDYTLYVCLVCGQPAVIDIDEPNIPKHVVSLNPHDDAYLQTDTDQDHAHVPELSPDEVPAGQLCLDAAIYGFGNATPADHLLRIGEEIAERLEIYDGGDDDETRRGAELRTFLHLIAAHITTSGLVQ